MRPETVWVCRLIHADSVADHSRHRVQRLQNCVVNRLSFSFWAPADRPIDGAAKVGLTLRCQVHCFFSKLQRFECQILHFLTPSLLKIQVLQKHVRIAVKNDYQYTLQKCLNKMQSMTTDVTDKLLTVIIKIAAKNNMMRWWAKIQISQLAGWC